MLPEGKNNFDVSDLQVITGYMISNLMVYKIWPTKCVHMAHHYQLQAEYIVPRVEPFSLFKVEKNGRFHNIFECSSGMKDLMQYSVSEDVEDYLKLGEWMDGIQGKEHILSRYN